MRDPREGKVEDFTSEGGKMSEFTTEMEFFSENLIDAHCCCCCCCVWKRGLAGFGRKDNKKISIALRRHRREFFFWLFSVVFLFMLIRAQAVNAPCRQFTPNKHSETYGNCCYLTTWNGIRHWIFGTEHVCTVSRLARSSTLQSSLLWMLLLISRFDSVEIH